MKSTLVLLIGLTMAPLVVMATTVNPTSNVLGDTAATASTLVLRDANGAIDGAQLIAASVDTTKVKANAVDTGKLQISAGSVDSGKLVCIRPGNLSAFGTCANGSIGPTGICTCQ